MSPIYGTAYAYVNACCSSLSVSDFENILSEDVTLHHQTNNEEPFKAQGKKEVSTLFKKYIFDNTSNIDVKSISLKKINSNVRLKLIVDEDKHESGKINRYSFKEITLFQFKENDGRLKISSITMEVQRTPIDASL